MKRVNSYYARGGSLTAYAPTSTTKVLEWVPQIPNYVWLAMIILTVSALSFSTLMRSQEQESEAASSYSYTKTRVENARNANQRIKEQTEQIKHNSRVAAQTAQEQLLLLRRNEIVVAVP